MIKYVVAIGMLLLTCCIQKHDTGNVEIPETGIPLIVYDTMNANACPCILYSNKHLISPSLTLSGDSVLPKDRLTMISSKSQQIKTYRITDNYYAAKLSTGKLSGIISLSIGPSGQVSTLTGNWSILGDMVDTSGMEILDYIQRNYLPCLPASLKVEGVHEIIHRNFTETFSLFNSPDSNDRQHGYIPHWTLDYRMKPRSKKVQLSELKAFHCCTID